MALPINTSPMYTVEVRELLLHLLDICKKRQNHGDPITKRSPDSLTLNLMGDTTRQHQIYEEVK